MRNPEIWTAPQLRSYIVKQYDDGAPPVFLLLNRWLGRGDGVAVYENHELGHPEMGLCQITSYGSQAAQIEAPEPPAILPDIGHRINWRYVLIATYRGDQIDDGDHDDRSNGGNPPGDDRDRSAAG